MDNDRSQIFIASSGRTLVLAEKLRDELTTEFCDATLWSDEGRLVPGATIIEMLESAAEQYDFAIIILAKDDVMAGGTGRILKARDNCVFEAGLFMSAIGRKRCFLVNSVSQNDLPSDLNGVISIRFDEPANLSDRSACAHAIAKVAAQLKNVVQREGPSGYHTRLPLLSVPELFRRERPRSEGGDLVGGQVVVLDTQPWVEIEWASLVRRNMDNGTSYQYFLHFSDDTIEKICLGLQVIAWAGLGDEERASDFKSRVDAIRNKKDIVLDDLSSLCQSGLLRVSLMMDPPIVSFRVHNASNSTLAKLYTKYYGGGFVQWAEGAEAYTLWSIYPRFVEEDTGDKFFLPLKPPADIGAANRQRLETIIGRELGRYFPGMGPDVARICLGDKP